jgi:hypothetical protein
VRQVETDPGLRSDLPTSEEPEEIERPKRLSFGAPTRSWRPPRLSSRPSSTQTDRSERVDRWDRGGFGVQPICRVLGGSAAAHYQRSTGHRSTRSGEYERMAVGIREVCRANFEC